MPTTADPHLPAPVPGSHRATLRALWSLALPLVIANSLQAVVTGVDAWYAARISLDAVAALGAQSYLNLAVFLALGGAAFAVQVGAAQAFGAGDRAAWLRQKWAGLATSAMTLPLFMLLALAGETLFRWVGMPEALVQSATEYWGPRLLGGPVVVALFALTSYLAGLGRTRAALWASLTAAAVNWPLNELFIFGLGWGLAGSAWASTVASLCGVLHALWLAREHAPAAGRVPMADRRQDVRALVVMGVPIGLSAAVDVLGFAAFQMMMARLGVVEAAATQLLLTLSGFAFWPALGVAMASTTLIGHARGAGQQAQLPRIAMLSLVVMSAWMAACGALLLVFGAPLSRWFLGPGQADVQAVVLSLLLVLALYQVFDAINLGCAFCLRGLDDARWASIAGAIATFPVFLPLVALLAYESGSMAGLPSAGLGVAGGWYAAAGYTVLLAALFAWRLRGRLARVVAAASKAV